MSRNLATNRAFVIHSRDLWLPLCEKPGSTECVVRKIFKVDIFKAEKTGNLRKFTEVIFLRRKSVPCRVVATQQVANRKKPEICQEKQNPGSIVLQCPGESKWRDSKRNLNLRTAPLERSHCSFRLIRSPLFRLCRTAHCADVRLAHPRPYRPRVRIPATDKQKWESPVKGAPIFVSKWRDSNPRPFGPEPNALPNCATPRCWSR